MYLQPESVHGTFEVIERFAGEGSEVVFDYVRASVLRREGACYGEREIAESVSKAGERWCFGIEEGEQERLMEMYGFRVSEHKDAEELERRYFTDSSGKIVGRINGTHCIVRAVKPGQQRGGFTVSTA
jgi:O-methyltransferase involved in polyketide biosynthesis